MRVDFALKSSIATLRQAVISIYFKEDGFIESKRSELYGWTSFLSSCGGKTELESLFQRWAPPDKMKLSEVAV